MAPTTFRFAKPAENSWVRTDKADNRDPLAFAFGVCPDADLREESMNKNTIIAALLALVVGGALGWGSVYPTLQAVQQRAAQIEEARAAAEKSAQALDGQLRDARKAVEKLQADGKAAEQALKEAKDQLAGAMSAKQAAEKGVNDLKAQLAAAQAAKQAADKALADASSARQRAEEALAEAVTAREAAEKALAEASKGEAKDPVSGGGVGPLVGLAPGCAPRLTARYASPQIRGSAISRQLPAGSRK
jgi:hypothetical protein